MANYQSLPNARRGGTALTQYRAVLLDTSGAFEIGPITNANAERPIGILQDDPAATNEPCDVALYGVCKANLGGTVTVGQQLISNNSGQLIADAEVADGGAVDVHHIADALESGSSGETKLVLLHTPVRQGLE